MDGHELSCVFGLLLFISPASSLSVLQCCSRTMREACTARLQSAGCDSTYDMHRKFCNVSLGYGEVLVVGPHGVVRTSHKTSLFGNQFSSLQHHWSTKVPHPMSGVIFPASYSGSWTSCFLMGDGSVECESGGGVLKTIASIKKIYAHPMGVIAIKANGSCVLLDRRQNEHALETRGRVDHVAVGMHFTAFLLMPERNTRTHAVQVQSNSTLMGGVSDIFELESGACVPMSAASSNCIVATDSKLIVHSHNGWVVQHMARSVDGGGCYMFKHRKMRNLPPPASLLHMSTHQETLMFQLSPRMLSTIETSQTPMSESHIKFNMSTIQSAGCGRVMLSNGRIYSLVSPTKLSWSGFIGECAAHMKYECTSENGRVCREWHMRDMEMSAGLGSCPIKASSPPCNT